MGNYGSSAGLESDPSGERKIAEDIGIVFTPEEAVEATKDFEGYIVDAEYGMNPLGHTGRPDIEQREQLCIQIRTETYEKDQLEWFAPSKVKLTKWHYFLLGLNKTGALKDTDSAGKTAQKKMANFAKSLIGMNFRWLERMNLESAGSTPLKRLLLPETYLGKVEVVKAEEIESEDVTLE